MPPGPSLWWLAEQHLKSRLVAINMAISASISRLAAYYERHGFGASIRRAALSLKRTLSSSRIVVFYCDLPRNATAATNMPAFLKVERIKNYAGLGAKDLLKMTSFWNPKQAHRDILERFEKGASLWLIWWEDSLAGYSWTMRGRTIAPYYFPMATDDVQLFDFYVFPQFRGRAILWFLITHILHLLQNEGAARVYGDVAEWNQASLSFYKTIPFERLGMVRSFTILGHTFVFWDAKELVRQTQNTPGILERRAPDGRASGEKA
jgi:GNAT superfamily N-acetyltransferase